MIKKRYTDFLKLRSVLCEVFYYRIIPILPPKNFRSKLQKQKDFFYERAKGLKRFLDLVIRDPELFNLKATRDFFMDESEFHIFYDMHFGSETQMSKIYKSQSKFFSSALQTVKSFTGLSSDKGVRIEAKDVKFVQMEQEIDHLKSFLANHLENIIELKRGFQGLRSNFDEVLGMLKEHEQEVQWEEGQEGVQISRDSVLTDIQEPEQDLQIDRLKGRYMFKGSIYNDFIFVVVFILCLFLFEKNW